MINSLEITALKQLPLLTKLRYWHHSEVNKYDSDPYHQHNFWQVDIAKKGSAVMHTDSKDYHIEAGDFVFIPPGVTHNYYYQGLYRNWSLKFQLENYNSSKVLSEPYFLKAAKTTDCISQLIETIMNKYTRGLGEFALPSHANDIVLIEYQLAGIISWFIDQHPKDSILNKIRQIINEHHCMPVKVSKIASQLGYSREYLNIIVKNASGISVKCFLDEERSLIAKRFIKYSDMNLSEIADYMGFPDVFGFSKFFSRMNGTPPSKWKAKNSS